MLEACMKVLFVGRGLYSDCNYELQMCLSWFNQRQTRYTSHFLRCVL
jgi:hypothetical protein